MRIHFNELFIVQNGAVTPRVVVRIGGVQMGPGVAFGSGVFFGGVDLTQYIGKYLEAVQASDGVWEITGFYN